MNRDVTIRIKGIQIYPNGEKVETITEEPAEYFERNLSRYVRFEEASEGFTETAKCLMKIREGYLEISKKGLIESFMTFEKGKIHQTEYRTPFGSVNLDIETNCIRMFEEENALSIQIEYLLKAQGEHMAQCEIGIFIKNKK